MEGRACYEVASTRHLLKGAVVPVRSWLGELLWVGIHRGLGLVGTAHLKPSHKHTVLHSAAVILNKSAYNRARHYLVYFAGAC